MSNNYSDEYTAALNAHLREYDAAARIMDEAIDTHRAAEEAFNAARATYFNTVFAADQRLADAEKKRDAARLAEQR